MIINILYWPYRQSFAVDGGGGDSCGGGCVIGIALALLVVDLLAWRENSRHGGAQLASGARPEAACLLAKSLIGPPPLVGRGLRCQVKEFP